MERSKEELRNELELNHKIVYAVCSDYHDIYYANMDTDEMWAYRSSIVTNISFSERFFTGSYHANISFYVEHCVHFLDKTLFDDVKSCEGVRELLRNQNSYSFYYRSVRMGQIRYCQCLVTRMEENSREFVLAIRNVDKEKRHEMEWQRLLEEKMEMVLSMTRVYDNAVYVDLKNNTFQELRTINSIHNMVYSSNIFWAQIRKVCLNNVMPEFQQTMLDFVDVTTLEERMKNKNVITAQYIGKDMGWSEAYIIVGSRDENGHLLNMFYATRSIHEQKIKELEQKKKEREQYDIIRDALKAAETASKAKTAFLSNVSHDIRTPLNAIMGMTTIASSNLDDKAKVAGCLEKISAAGEQLLALINEVLDMSHIESGKMELREDFFDISDLMKRCVDIAQPEVAKHEHNMQLTIASNINTKVIGDEVNMAKIISNLISNMIKYTPDGGTLRVKLMGEGEAPEGYSRYKMVFQDNGMGIPEDLQETIFESFSRGDTNRTSKIQGTGLGLPIVRSIVQMMLGDITVKSKVNEGSVFEVVVLLKNSESSQENQHNMENEDLETREYKIEDLMSLGCENKRILMAEDNEVNAEIAKFIFEAAGLEIEHAIDGAEALEMVHENPDGYYDIVFMDIQMPKLNGYDTTRLIRKLHRKYTKELPIIAMTANAFSSDVEKAFMSGMNGHLAKPINIKEVYDILKKYLK